MQNQTQDEKKCNELRLLYQDAIDNIRFYKQQQWVITNYGILIYAAVIIAIYKEFGQITCYEKSLLSCVSVVVSIVGSVLIWSFHHRMLGCRKRMEKIRGHFDEVTIKAWEADNKSNHASIFHGIEIPLFLIFTLLLGMCTVWWLMFR